jgi:transposase-like protein
MTEDKVKVIVEMYLRGDAIADIAEAVDRNVNTVKHWIRYNRSDYGLTRRRVHADRIGVSPMDQEDTKWNIKLSKQYITKPWGSAA